MNALDWAANRGPLAVVALLLLLLRGVSMEPLSMYGGTALGTALGTAVWSTRHERNPDHQRIVDSLLRAGADPTVVALPTGDDEIDSMRAALENA